VTPSRLRLVTWNIHKGIGVDRRYALERTAQVLKSIDADVACLQEVDENVPRSQFHCQAERLAEALGHSHRAIGLNVAVQGGHYGNLTISRHPIVESKNLDLTFPFKKRRSALVTRIAGPGDRPWIVVNLHLGLMHFERKTQVRRLVSHIQAQAKDGEAVVIAGDWNDWGNRLLKEVAAPMGFHLARLDCHRAAGIKTFPSRRPLAALDKIFYRDPIRLHHVACVLDEAARKASDHLPLVADLTWHGSDGAKT
jgi:endonuclease/exonuclease/phosphatase family metal-dependent hydrolase